MSWSWVISVYSKFSNRWPREKQEEDKGTEGKSMWWLSQCLPFSASRQRLRAIKHGPRWERTPNWSPHQELDRNLAATLNLDFKFLTMTDQLMVTFIYLREKSTLSLPRRPELLMLCQAEAQSQKLSLPWWWHKTNHLISHLLPSIVCALTESLSWEHNWDSNSGTQT